MYPMLGTKSRNQAKYSTVATCPTSTHGVSTCSEPTNISTTKITPRTQKATRNAGRNCEPRTRDTSSRGIASRISSEANMATTPINLLGIDRRIA